MTRRCRGPGGHRLAWRAVAGLLLFGIVLGGCTETAQPQERVVVRSEPPPRVERPVRVSLGLGPWRLEKEDAAGRCRLTAAAQGVSIALQGTAGSPALVALEIKERPAPRFRRGSRYRLQAGRTRLVLAARSIREARQPVPASAAGGETLLGIASASSLRVTGPGVDLRLAVAPDRGATEAFVGCIDPAAKLVAFGAPAAPSGPRAWRIARGLDACGLHHLGGGLGVSVAGVRGAGLVVTVQRRGAFEAGRSYTVRFEGTAPAWSLSLSAVNANTLVWRLPAEDAARARLTDLLLGGKLSVPEAGEGAEMRLPPAGRSAEDFLRCGAEMLGTEIAGPPAEEAEDSPEEPPT